MFHIAPLLFDECRMRLIGNDVVNIIWLESGIWNPNAIMSTVCRTFGCFFKSFFWGIETGIWKSDAPRATVVLILLCTRVRKSFVFFWVGLSVGRCSRGVAAAPPG
jgi:hypothetical protein